MLVKFTHYLITRFNVRINGYGPEYMSPDVRTANWELERLPYFERYCVPSVEGQSIQDFNWLIFCDEATEETVIQRIKTAVKNIPQSTLIFVSSFERMISSIQEICSSANSPFVITSRLDNDDGLGIHYIRDIQSNFIPRDNVVLNLLGGVHYHADAGILTFHRYSLNNSFISLIEERKSAPELITVLGFRHLTPRQNMSVMNIKTKYSFWMTLHHQNTAPRKNLGWPIPLSFISGQYTIDPVSIKISTLGTIAYTIQWLPGALLKKFKYLYRSRIKSLVKPNSSVE